jgi:hypothetical protein
LLLKFSPVWVFIIKVFIGIVALVWRIFFLGKFIRLPVKRFLSEVIIPIGIIAALSIILVVSLHAYFSATTSGFIISCSASVVCMTFLIYTIGLKKTERIAVKNQIKRLLLNNI